MKLCHALERRVEFCPPNLCGTIAQNDPNIDTVHHEDLNLPPVFHTADWCTAWHIVSRSLGVGGVPYEIMAGNIMCKDVSFLDITPLRPLPLFTHPLCYFQ